MYQLRKLRLTASILLCFLLQAQGADKYTDENRPYEFGFKIDGQQHRHESKDKDGIIMGEFGFVTADDVYHVTVYATDKEGRFKILSMKNIHLKSTPESPSSARQGHSLALPPAQPASVQAQAPPPAAPTPPPFKPISIEPPGRSCSSCSIPTTTQVPPPAYNQVPPNQFSAPGPLNQQTFPFAGGSPYSPQAPQNYPAGQQNYPQQGPQNYPAGQQNYPQQGPGSPAIQNFAEQPGQSPPNYPGSPSYAQGPSAPNTLNNYAQGGAGQQPGIPQTYPGDQNSLTSGYNGPSDPAVSYPQGGAPGQPGPAKPMLVTAQLQIVDKDTDIHALRPGEKEGLPPGVTKNDMTQLLYTFNYTVGFHGHFEEGYTNGVKKGYYFVTGRNGVRTRIDYVADDTGFHPKVSQDILDLLSDDVPKPETEKDEKFGLKGYEFKWLYYPVDSKRR